MLSTPEPDLLLKERLKIFAMVHWRGLVCVFVPILCVVVLLPFPPEKYQWTLYCLLVMLVFCVTECVPLPVTAFMPVFVFPLSGVMSTIEVCSSFGTELFLTVIGNLVLAASVDQSGLHKRLAFIFIKSVGLSHEKLLVAMVVVTSFVAMWISSTVATSMMVPVVFAILKVFEDHKLLKIYDVTESGEKIASDITTCYFCTATYSATIGGLATYRGAGCSLGTFKDLFEDNFQDGPVLNFSKISAFTIPYIVLLDIFMILYILVIYVGFLRPNSAAAKRANIPPEGLVAAEATLSREYKALGPLSFWEFVVILLLGGDMVSIFCRTSLIFLGWGENIKIYYGVDIRSIAVAALAIIAMLLFPSNLSFCKNLNAQFYEDLPKKEIPSVLNWKNMMAELPFSFFFLTGAGHALLRAMTTTGFNDRILNAIMTLDDWPNIVLLLLIIIAISLVTNFSANIMAVNTYVPLSWQLAKVFGRNPLSYTLATGFSASFGFLLPLGTPSNLIVQGVAKIPTVKMVKAGLGPTITTIIVTWLAILLYAPIIWPDLNIDKPAWAE